MPTNPLQLTYIGGPTLLIEFAGLRLLTDPTFDPAPQDYPTPVYTLHKLQSPAVTADAIGPIDAVLLSHDHHLDNLDNTGRQLLSKAKRVLTTQAGADRLNQFNGGPQGDSPPNAQGLTPWQSTDLPTPSGATLRITATPARHGPEGGDRGPCIGFVLTTPDQPGANHTVYVSGDTVWYEGVAEIARRFPSTDVAVLFMGAARVAVAGPAHLTFTAQDGVEAARAFPSAAIVPVHFEGWAHFTQAKSDIDQTFQAAGLQHRLRWLPPGKPTVLSARTS